MDSNILKEIGKGQYDWAMQIGTLAFIWGLPIVTCWSDRLKKCSPRMRSTRFARSGCLEPKIVATSRLAVSKSF